MCETGQNGQDYDMVRQTDTDVLPDPPVSVTLCLPAAPDAPAKVRQCMRQSCGAMAGHLLYDAELLASEIVSNVVLHVGGTMTVDIRCDHRSLQVAVGDESHDMPVSRRAALSEIGGRGLQIVSRLAAEWGCRPQPNGAGKVVWFRIAA